MGKVSMSTTTFYTDRSRIVAFRNCPRLRYLTYHFPGPQGPMGIVPAGVSLPLIAGSAFHDTVAHLRVMKRPPAEVISEAASALRVQMEEAAKVFGEDPQAADRLVKEQVRLLEGLCWAWVRSRLPLIDQEFEPVVVEREILWPMGNHRGLIDVVDMVRCDVLERRRSDGLLFYREYKTTSSGDEEWAKQFDTSSQILANIQAVRDVLHEPVAGVIIEGVIKGSRAKDRSKTSPFFGQRIQQSALCYAYMTSSGLTTDWVPKARKVATWEHVSAQELVYQFLDEESCRSMFSPVPPIIPRDEHLARWRKQTVHQEGMIARYLQDAVDLDYAFPMNDDHCHRYFGNPCPYKDVCFDPAIGSDPLGSGLYVVRTPHHPTEPVGGG